ncbi:hypothetical protein HPS57_09750 [Prevotella sp. PINT]|uniref:DUF2586 domain-containing protein n=1 Tax=Palleniella intestinalis TaxID=2736291 RepID=UPI0015535FF6|nr:DUF2586 domain-containing protein [Palleniella intestinalis]NPD82249.1 hypothetical protein [Palleniella intestinalis]
MQLPRVKIQFLNGQLGTVGESPDGLMALVCGAEAVGDTMALNEPYTISGMDDLTALGVTAGNNAALHKHVREFYDEAGNGTRLVLYPVSTGETMAALCDYTESGKGFIRDLITRLNGALRGIAIANVGDGAAGSEGLAADVYSALPKAQQLAEWSTTELYAPLFMVIEGRSYSSPKSLKDLTQEDYNRVCVLIGDTLQDGKGACVGTLLGRTASVPVNRNIGRVKDGSLFPLEMFIGGRKVDESGSAVAEIYSKGYITPRKYVGRSGYFFTDDCMACDITDDYAHLAMRRVIDKAYRVVYDTALDFLLDEIELNDDGTMALGVVKSWQQAFENALNRQMTANGELSADASGEGCKCHIDEKQDIAATSRIKVQVKVRPHGYARYIDVDLGFLVASAS